MSYLAKVVAVGSSGVGKRSFFKSCDQIRCGIDSTYKSIGMTINITHHEFEDGDTIKLTLWNLSPNNRFLFVNNTMYRGATGCLLFFDVSSRSSFNDLPQWLEIIRNYCGDVPILLIGTKADLEHATFKDEIDHFVEINNINGYFQISKNSKIVQKFLFGHCAKKVIDYIRSGALLRRRHVYHNKDEPLTEEEKKLLDNFLTFFSKCPVCHKVNHVSYLERFFVNKVPEKRKLRDKLLELMDYSYFIGNQSQNEIQVGIPCCSCFEKFCKT